VGASTVHGRGVFARTDIAAGETIEVCPALVLSAQDYGLLDQTSLAGYYFDWENGEVAIPLGLGALYNHSNEPNADVTIDVDALTIIYAAVRAITEGDEVCISYVTDESALWFEITAGGPGDG
jgi:SET domain-containing protein